MKKSSVSAGYFHNGLPYNRAGGGPRTLVIFQGSGMGLDNKPLSPVMASLFFKYYPFAEEDYTIYLVPRNPHLPDGYSLQDMADDYAVMIRQEFGEPVDVIGVSTGGSIAQYFAADHPDLVRKLIIHSSAYTLSDSTKQLMLRIGDLVRQRQWRAAYAAQVDVMHLARPVAWLGALVAGMFVRPKIPSDLVVTIEAEDKFNFMERLGQIAAPTLVVAGDQDPFYTAALFHETATGIPNARLILYPGLGHPVHGKQFDQDVSLFLNESV